MEDYKNLLLQRLTKDLLDMQLLRFIEKEPLWGYKIKKTVEQNLGIKLRHGALYPALNQLEKNGFIQSKIEPQGGRARKIYKLTPQGKVYLRAYYAVLKEQLKSA